MVNKTVTIFDYPYYPYLITYPTRPYWWCKQPGCNHQTEFLTIALFHQHNTHGIPMQELEQRADHIVHKTETALDTGQEVQKRNT